MTFNRDSAARDLAIAVSLANLWHVRHWSWLLNYSNNDYYRDRPLHWSMAATPVLGVVVVAAAFFLAARLARRHPRAWPVELARLCFIAVCLLALNAVRHQAKNLTLDAVIAMLGGGAVASALLALLAAALLAAATVARWRRALSHALAILTLCFAPLVAVTVGQALRAIVRYDPLPLQFQRRPSAALLPLRAADAPRVLFVVFDGFDQDTAFDNRPVDLELPEFDRFLAGCVHADKAYPPSHSTAESLPTYTAGVDLFGTRVVGANDLELLLPDGRAVRWSQARNLFDRARELGVNSSLIGWYHPYCRVLGSSVATCEAHPYLPPSEYSLQENARRHLCLLLETVPGSIRLGLAERLGLEPIPLGAQRRWHLYVHQDIQRAAIVAAADARYGLVFVHYPIPHWPFIYSHRAAATDVDGSSTYMDNLALADRTLGELRRVLERHGVWDTTTVIITSDHWNRSGPLNVPLAAEKMGDPRFRIPFLVKTGRGRTAIACRGLFRTQHAHDLTLAILAGAVRDPKQVAQWIDEHSEGPRGLHP